MPTRTFSKLYEPASLCNTDHGFELAFKNTVAPSTLTAIGRLTVGEHRYEAGEFTVRLERPAGRHGQPPSARQFRGDSVSVQRMLPFDLYTIARVMVPGKHLAAGRYQVTLTIKTKEVGDIVLLAEDSVN